MALEETKKDLMEAEADMRSYLEHSKAYYELRMFRILMKPTVTLAQTIMVGFVAVIALGLFSFTTAYGLGQWLGNTFHGFLIVSGFYLLATALCYLFRKRLNAPLLKRFSRDFFQ